MLSGLSHAAGMVFAPKSERPLKHIEFVHQAPGRALVVLVTEGGMVENRVIDVPIGLPPSSLVEATNYLTQRLTGRTITTARGEIVQDLESQRAELNELTRKVVEAGLATWSNSGQGALIVRGQSHLLDSVTEIADLERGPRLVLGAGSQGAIAEAPGSGRQCGRRADLHRRGERAVRPRRLLGGDLALSRQPAPADRRRGVIGPSRINYARIIPMVDYTAKVIGRILG